MNTTMYLGMDTSPQFFLTALAASRESCNGTPLLGEMTADSELAIQPLESVLNKVVEANFSRCFPHLCSASCQS